MLMVVQSSCLTDSFIISMPKELGGPFPTKEVLSTMVLWSEATEQLIGWGYRYVASCKVTIDILAGSSTDCSLYQKLIHYFGKQVEDDTCGTMV